MNRPHPFLFAAATGQNGVTAGANKDPHCQLLVAVASGLDGANAGADRDPHFLLPTILLEEGAPVLVACLSLLQLMLHNLTVVHIVCHKRAGGFSEPLLHSALLLHQPEVHDPEGSLEVCLI